MAFTLKQGIGTAAQAAMAFMAAKQAGPQAVAALMQGIQQGKDRQRQQQQQEQDRLLRQQMQQSTLEDRAFDRKNAEADNARADATLGLTRRKMANEQADAYGNQILQTATDPAAAENAMMQAATTTASQYGLAPDALSGSVARLSPMVAPAISARKKKQARELYDSAEKRYNPKGENPEWETSITLQTEAFGNVTPAKLREMYDAPAVDSNGAPALPPKARRSDQANVGSFEDYIVRKYGDNPTPEQITEARRVYQQADDKPVSALSGQMRDVQLQLAQDKLDTQRAARADTTAKTERQRASLQSQGEETLNEINRLLDKDGNLTPGAQAITGGSRLLHPELLPGSRAADAKASLDRVKSRLIVDLITEMKSQSKTGATGFGQLSDQERLLLESAAGRLSTAQSETALRDALLDIRRLTKKSVDEANGRAGATTTDAPGNTKKLRYNPATGKVE